MRRTHLSVEPLEGREVPAQFGIPWANGTSLTVSFAPDGADVDGRANELAALMARSGLAPAVWQREILEAFQAWARQADLNFGVVSDDGSPLGAAGNMQADPRFGDIRIFAAPLSGGVLAITTPPGDLAGTRTGDIILNSNYNFGVGAGAQRDLYTVFLQEAGHALGVGNSPSTSSAMYEFYQGVRADEEARVAPGIEQEPGRQGRGGRLPMGSRDDHRGLSRQQVLPHGLWQREDRKAPADGFGRLDVVAKGRVPDHDRVALRGNVLRSEPRGERDPEALEGGRHGRIELAVATGDPVALLEQEGRQGDHGRPAHGHEVEPADSRRHRGRSLV